VADLYEVKLDIPKEGKRAIFVHVIPHPVHPTRRFVVRCL